MMFVGVIGGAEAGNAYGFVAASALAQDGDQNVSVAYPAGILENDILIIHCAYTSSAGSWTFDVPSGFAQIAATNNGGIAYNPHALFWKRADGTESGTVAVSVSGSGGSTPRIAAIMCAIGGCVTSGDPFDAEAANTGSSSTSLTAPSITAPAGDLYALNFVSSISDITLTPPASYSEHYDEAAVSTRAASLGLNSKLVPIGSTGGSVTTASASAFYWSVFSLVMLEGGRTGPIFTVAPSISQPDGFVGVGDTLTLDPGTSDSDSETYQWYEDGVAISGATGLTYTLTSSELGGNITAVVSATNVYGTTDETSNSLGPVVTPAFTTQTLTLSGGGDITLSDASDLEISNRTA